MLAANIGNLGFFFCFIIFPILLLPGEEDDEDVSAAAVGSDVFFASDARRVLVCAWATIKVGGGIKMGSTGKYGTLGGY